MRPEGSLTIVRFARTRRKGEGASSSLAGLCQASWKPWHKSIRCRPHYVNKESCLKSGAGSGKQDIATPGGGGQGAGFPQVLPSGPTHSKWAIISCHMYVLPQGRKKITKNRKPYCGWTGLWPPPSSLCHAICLNPVTQEEEAGRHLWEFDASLVYAVSSAADRTT